MIRAQYAGQTNRTFKKNGSKSVLSERLSQSAQFNSEYLFTNDAKRMYLKTLMNCYNKIAIIFITTIVSV